MSPVPVLENEPQQVFEFDPPVQGTPPWFTFEGYQGLAVLVCLFNLLWWVLHTKNGQPPTKGPFLNHLTRVTGQLGGVH